MIDFLQTAIYWEKKKKIKEERDDAVSDAKKLLATSADRLSQPDEFCKRRCPGFFEFVKV